MDWDMDRILTILCFITIALSILINIFYFFVDRKDRAFMKKSRENLDIMQIDLYEKYRDYFEKYTADQSKNFLSLVNLQKENSLLKERVQKLEDSYSSAKVTIKV